LAEGGFGFINLKPYNLSFDYLGQVLHTTQPCPYHDTINLAIAHDSNNNAVLTAFSISQFAGALCDIGQNYWNINTIVAALGWTYSESTVMGCPIPPPPPPTGH